MANDRRLVRLGCAVVVATFYPKGLVLVLPYPFVCFPQHKKLELFRSLVQYRLSCDLANSNVDCQLELIRTVDCFWFFFVFFSFLSGDSSSNLSIVTHDFVGTRALADVSEFPFLFFFSFPSQGQFHVVLVRKCTRNGPRFRNLSAFLRFERSFVGNSIKKFCFGILANSLRAFFRSLPQAEHWPTKTNTHFKTIFSERPYLLYLNRNQSFLWPSLTEDDEGISQQGEKFSLFASNKPFCSQI